MVATSLQNDNWQTFVQTIKKDFPDIDFIEAESSSWSPKHASVSYSKKSSFELSASSLLHEIGHMMAKHSDYQQDIQLLIMESEAWQKALRLAKKYRINIDKDHVEDCLDTYRNWLHKRSACPNCTMTGSQKNRTTYNCLNCLKQWNVSKSRFCRAYRMTN